MDASAAAPDQRESSAGSARVDADTSQVDPRRVSDAIVDAVVKVGGGLLRQPGALERVASALAGVARRHRLVVVPGGGPFADAVREVDRDIGLGHDAAHWMAILGMEQFAHLLASRIPAARLVEHPAQLAAVWEDQCVPVLAPFRWLRQADPLPHSWDVTSDSIASWIAGALGARRLVLVKPAGGEAAQLVDGYFARALPAGVEPLMLPVLEVGRLASLLDTPGSSPLV